MSVIAIVLWVELAGVLLYGLYVIAQKNPPIHTDGWTYYAAILVVSLVWFIWLPMKAFNTLMKARKASL